MWSQTGPDVPLQGTSSPNQTDRTAGTAGSDAARAAVEGAFSNLVVPLDIDELANHIGQAA